MTGLAGSCPFVRATSATAKLCIFAGRFVLHALGELARSPADTILCFSFNHVINAEQANNCVSRSAQDLKTDLHAEPLESQSCLECHKKKIKCNGQGPPCSTCAELSIECTYPVRDKKTKVGQRYLDKLEAENKRLAALVSSLSTPGASPAAQSPAEPRADNADRNPLIEERPWFLSFKNVDLPIHIGEAADAAFATRLRQAATLTTVSHLPRVNYLSDDALRGFADTSSDLPNVSRLRFLIEVALKTTSRNWHICRKSVILEDVRRVVQDSGSCDWLAKCRIWALLAIGEAFSSRCVMPNESFPGARYWTKAMSLAYMPSERPKLDVVEVNLLMVGAASADLAILNVD